MRAYERERALADDERGSRHVDMNARKERKTKANLTGGDREKSEGGVREDLKGTIVLEQKRRQKNYTAGTCSEKGGESGELGGAL